jgi:hypothetical protein
MARGRFGVFQVQALRCDARPYSCAPGDATEFPDGRKYGDSPRGLFATSGFLMKRWDRVGREFRKT